MLNLSEENKKNFTHRVKSITKEDEMLVRNEIPTELEKLKNLIDNSPSPKLEELLNNAEFLYMMLHDHSFPMTDSSRNWVVFGLGYLISDIDLIPDMIPKLGYYDDALVLSWVFYMIHDDVERYNSFLLAKSKSEVGGVINKIIQGDGLLEIIVIPGFLSNNSEILNQKMWVSKIKEAGGLFARAGISIVEHKIGHLTEFMKTIKIIDHDLTLKPVYDFEKFKVDYHTAKLEFEMYGKALAKDLVNFKINNPGKEIAIISIDLGSITSNEAISKVDKGLIDKYFIFGGSSRNNILPKMEFRNVMKVYNFFSENDHALKFIFDNFEEMQDAVGLNPLLANKVANIENFNCSSDIKSHFDYKYKLSKLLNVSKSY